MLSPLDADLARRDPAVPGLAIVLDPEALVDALRRSSPAGHLEAARATYVKYKPGTNCLAGYRLTVDGAEVDAYAKAFGDNATRKLEKAREQPGQPGALGPGRIPLQEGQIVVSTFPNDAKVTALLTLADPRPRSQLLRDLFPDLPGQWTATVRGLVYKPERRFVAQLLPEDGSPAVLKLYNRRGFEMVQRHRRPYEARAPLRLAPRVGESERHAALAFEWLHGRLLSEAILDPQFDARAVVTVGAAIAQLHAQSPDGLTHLTRERGRSELLAEADTVGLLCPRLAARARLLARKIAAGLEVGPPAYGLIHGDFHARQVLLDGDAAALLDLDRAVYADPLIDLGLFAAHLEREVIRGNLPAGRVQPLVLAMLEGYAMTRRRPRDEEIELHTAAELLRLAPRSFRYREPNWPERIEACLDRVETLVAAVPHRPAEVTR